MNKQTTIEAPAGNLRIWDALAKTDPAHTKPFNRAGGFKGTAIKPIYIIKRLTDQFGPCGEGWGIGEPKFELVHSQEGEVLVFCTVRCWHGQDRSLYGVGGDKVVVRRNDGKMFHDDEAFKKAFTDAVGNAFKFLGVSADVHMGQFDDSKYVEEVRAEFEEPKREKVPGIAKIKTTLNELMRAGNAATDLEAFNALVHNCKTELQTIKEASHDYWTGDGGDEHEGFKKWIVRRRAELAPVELSEDAQMLLDTLGECTNGKELQGWLRLYGDRMEALDGAESRRVEARYNEVETGLRAVANLGAG
jgi:hypothetical protein